MLEELQKLMADSGLTLKEIADGSGVSVYVVRAISSGARPNPTIKTYTALKTYLEGRRKAA